jgi:hypothetical protein
MTRDYDIKRERLALYHRCRRFLEEYEAGERPEADPEAVRLARVVVEETPMTGNGGYSNEAFRNLVGKAAAAWSEARRDGASLAEQEEIVRPYLVPIREAEARIDAAAAGLARIGEA